MCVVPQHMDDKHFLIEYRCKDNNNYISVCVNIDNNISIYLRGRQHSHKLAHMNIYYTLPCNALKLLFFRELSSNLRQSIDSFWMQKSYRKSRMALFCGDKKSNSQTSTFFN